MTGRDFSFTRICDDHPVGHKIDGSLEVIMLTPLGDNYEHYDDARSIMETSGAGQVIVRLVDDPSLGRELRLYLQTEQYVKTKHTGSLPEATKRILRDRSDDNRARRARILQQLRVMLEDASYFASGQKLDIHRSDPKQALGDALEYLIENAYPKMGYIQHVHSNPKQEIQSLLRANDLEQASLGLDAAETNQQALEDLRDYVQLSARQSRQIVLYELINDRFGGRPYGWLELEVVLLVARLAVLKEINLLVNAAPLPLDQAFDHLTSSSRQRRVIITLRESADMGLIKKAQSLGKALFAQQGPAGEDSLFKFIQERLAVWDGNLATYEPLARTGNYPGQAEIESCRATLRKFVQESDSLRFLKRVLESRDDLLDLAEDFRDLDGFYTNQKHSWESLRKAVQDVSPNRLQLEAHPEGGAALAQMETILGAEHPYGMLHEVANLSQTARQVNAELVSEERGPAVVAIQGLLNGIEGELDQISADEGLRTQATRELARLLDTATQATSIAHIAQARQHAESAYDRSLAAIESAQTVVQPSDPGDPTPPAKPKVKKRRVVETKHLWSGDFIETPEELDTFLNKLRAEIEDALDASERVQIK